MKMYDIMQLKQYMAPTTDVFTFGPNERLMDEPIIMAGSPSMPNPAPIRNPLD